MLSLRASALKWRGNPPVEWNQVTITTKNCGDFYSFRYYSVHFPSNRGIATPVCGLVRNDRKLEGEAAKQQLTLEAGGRYAIIIFL